MNIRQLSELLGTDPSCRRIGDLGGPGGDRRQRLVRHEQQVLGGKATQTKVLAHQDAP